MTAVVCCMKTMQSSDVDYRKVAPPLTMRQPIIFNPEVQKGEAPIVAMRLQLIDPPLY